MLGVEAETQAVVSRLEERTPELAAAAVERMRAEVDELRAIDTAELWRALDESTRSGLRTEFGYLRRNELPESCPPDAADGVRLAAMAGIPLTVVLQTQRLAHAVVWDAYSSEAEALADAPALRRRLLDEGSRFFFAYGDRLARLVEERYRHEEERLAASRSLRRLREVMAVLDGSMDAWDQPDYPLDALHLGAVASGTDAEAALRALAQLLDRRALVVSASGGAAWGWLGGTAPPADGWSRGLARFEAGDARIALGECAPGVEGFRETHRQAHEAHRVALRRPGAITAYADVALEAMALRDEAAARRFVALQLSPLGHDDRGHDLRQTLRAYFACSQKVAATAAALGVHEQTVAQRLRAIEERIGRPVNSRRAELETALRLAEVLD